MKLRDEYYKHSGALPVQYTQNQKQWKEPNSRWQAYLQHANTHTHGGQHELITLSDSIVLSAVLLLFTFVVVGEAAKTDDIIRFDVRECCGFSFLSRPNIHWRDQLSTRTVLQACVRNVITIIVIIM